MYKQASNFCLYIMERWKSHPDSEDDNTQTSITV